MKYQISPNNLIEYSTGREIKFFTFDWDSKKQQCVISMEEYLSALKNLIKFKHNTEESFKLHDRLSVYFNMRNTKILAISEIVPGDTFLSSLVILKFYNSRHCTKGIIGIDEDNNIYEGLYFKSIFNVGLNLYDNPEDYGDGKLPTSAISYELAKSIGLKPSLRSDNFIPEDKKESIGNFSVDYSRTTHSANENNYYYREVMSFSKDKRVLDNLEKYVSSNSWLMELEGGVLDIITKYTYGIEYEVIKGGLHHYMLPLSMLIPLVDGSIRGSYEYTSIPMQGKDVIRLASLQSELLSSRCRVDHRCALHFHIGGYERSPENIVKLHLLIQKIQQSIYDIYPYYKKHEVSILGKQKEYSAEVLPLVGTSEEYESSREAFIRNYAEEIVRFYTCDRECENIVDSVIEGSYETLWNRKWRCPTRYFWTNFVSYLTGGPGTVEFRISEPSVNPDNVIGNLLLFTSIIDFASTKSIEDVFKVNSIDDIVNTYKFSLMGAILKDFVNCRRKASKENKKFMYYTALNRVPEFRQLVQNSEVNNIKSQRYHGEFNVVASVNKWMNLKSIKK